MVGAFGLLDGYHATHFPGTHLVENRARIDAFKLNRIGAFAEGTVTRLALGGHRGCLLARRAPNVSVNGKRVLVLWDEQARAFFECPACGRRCKHLYLDELACRTCLRLDYSSRHLHRTVPGLHRIRRLRRKIGVDQRPFAPLPRRQRHHLHYHRIVAEITRLERGLVNYLGSINRDLDRRIRVRKAKGSW